MPSLLPQHQRHTIQAWKSKITSWVEAHPIQAAAVFTTIFTTIGVGILQEIANRIIDTEIAPWLGVSAHVYRWVVIGVLLLLSVMCFIIWQQSLRYARHLSHANMEPPAATHKRMKHAEAQLALLGAHFKASMETIETLTRYLATFEWGGGGDPRELQQLLIPIVVKRVQRMYANQHLVQHAYVFTPSMELPDYLTVFYANVNNYSGINQSSKWYVGEDKKGRRVESGTAGTVFIRKSPIVHHINPDTHQAEEGKDYISSRKPGEPAMYLSFVAMPLMDGDKCLGVLCLDSSARDTFDDDPNQVVLEPAAKLLVQILKLQQRAQESK